MTRWIRYQGHEWNHKRVRRVYCKLKLNHRIKPKKRLPSRNPEPLVVPTSRNQKWSMDFMQDSLETGKRFRTLNVIDDFNREVLAMFLFKDLDDVATLTTKWMYDYNHLRPHHSLQGKPPMAVHSR